MKKLLSILLTALIIINSSFMNVFAAVGTEQKLKYENKDDGIPMFMAVEDGESFYVYCFNSNLAWPDRPDDQESGYTIQTYVPNDFIELDNYYVDVNGTQKPVKDILHRIFYAGFPHNNAGLYIQSDNYAPTAEEMAKGLVFSPEVLTLFPELNSGIYTYKSDGTGTLNNPNTTEGQTFANVGFKMMEWIFGTPEEQENFKKLQTEYRDFYAFAYAYYSAADYGSEIDEYLPFFYLMALGSTGTAVTKEEAHSATQIAIWIILNRANVPYNTKTFDENNLEGTLVRRLVDFAYGDDPIPERNFSQEVLNEYKTNFDAGKYLLNGNNQTVKDNGGIKFTYNPSDGKYYSEVLKFERKITETLREKAYLSKFNIEIINSENVVISETVQYGKEDFILVCDEKPAGAKVSVKSNNYWPSPIYQYRAKSDVDNNEMKYQEMSGVKYERVELGFELLALDENTDLTIKKLVNNNGAASGVNFWFDANIKILDTYGNQVNGWLDYSKYKLDSSGNAIASSKVDGKVYNYGNNNGLGGNNTKFSLQANEEIVIHNLPSGTTYSIDEYGLSETGSSLGNWTPTISGNNGTISKTATNLIEVTNEYKYDSISLQINGEKTLRERDGGLDLLDFAAGDFTFILWPDVHGNPMPSGSVYDDETLRYKKVVSNSAQDTTSKVATFDFGTITFDKAGTYSYTIEEQQVTLNNISKDPSHYDVTVVVTEGTTSFNKTVTVSHHNPDHSLIGSSVTVAEGSPATVSFENTYSNAVIDKEIRIKKTVVNNSSNANISRKDYQFKIEPKNTDDLGKYPELSSGLKSCVVTTGDSGEAVSPLIEFTDSWFDTNDANQDNVIELEYKISEVEGSLDYIDYSDEVAYAKITITKNPGATPLETSYSAVIKYTYGSHADVETPPVFTNIYSASSEYEINLNKAFTSSIGTYTPTTGEKYKFVINDDFERNGDKSGYVLPTDKTITLTYDGTNFVSSNKTIVFNKAGNYRFELSEVVGNVKDIIYDTNNWILDLEVTEKDTPDGEFNINSEYYNESATINGISGATFTNKHKATVSLDLNVSKKLLGRELTENDEFTFTVHHSEGLISNPCDPTNYATTHINLEHPLQLVLNSTTSFDVTLPHAIKIHNTGKYYVSVIEDVPVSAKMTYDQSVYIMEIDVEKVGNNLKVKDGYPKYYKAPNTTGWALKTDATSNFEFTNKTTTLSVQKKTENCTPGSKFKFEITLTDSLDNPLSNQDIYSTLNGNSYTLSTDENGKATFELTANSVLCIPDLPDKTKYKLEEVNSLTTTTKILRIENEVEKPLVEGKIIIDSLEAGISELLIVNNKGKYSYTPPKTGIE